MKKLEIAGVEDAIDAIQEEICRSDESRFHHRLHALLLICNGQSCQQVADLFVEDRRTVQRWVKRFESDGIDGLREAQRVGRPASLNTRQWARLKRELLRAPPTLPSGRKKTWNPKILIEHLQVNYEVLLGLRQCQRIILEIAPSIAARRRK